MKSDRVSRAKPNDGKVGQRKDGWAFQSKADSPHTHTHTPGTTTDRRKDARKPHFCPAILFCWPLSHWSLGVCTVKLTHSESRRSGCRGGAHMCRLGARVSRWYWTAAMTCAAVSLAPVAFSPSFDVLLTSTPLLYSTPTTTTPFNDNNLSLT